MMLKLKYLFENYDLAKEALGNWEHDADTLDEMLSRFRISSNAIYPFCQNDRVCFLRLAHLEEKLEKNVFGELEFIDYLCSCGYPALEPVPAKKGEICLMRRFINLYSSARLVRCTAEQYAQEPEWMVNLRRKLEKVISKKEAEREGIWKVN